SFFFLMGYARRRRPQMSTLSTVPLSPVTTVRDFSSDGLTVRSSTSGSTMTVISYWRIDTHLLWTKRLRTFRSRRVTLVVAASGGCRGDHPSRVQCPPVMGKRAVEKRPTPGPATRRTIDLGGGARRRSPVKPVLVVGVGGDIGVYAFQRAAHEQYGWQPVVLAPVMTTFMKHSTLVDYVITPGLHDPDVLVARLNDFAASHPDNELILFTNLDWHVRVIAERRAELDPRWLMPLCELSAFDRISSKTAFAAACDAVGVRTPRTVPVVFTRTDDAEAGQGAGAGAAAGTVHAAQAIDAIRT